MKKLLGNIFGIVFCKKHKGALYDSNGRLIKIIH